MRSFFLVDADDDTVLSATSRRARCFCALDHLLAGQAAPRPGGPRSAKILEELSARGALFPGPGPEGGITLSHQISATAVDRLTDDDGRWAPHFGSRLRKKVRPIDGALFHLPLENGEDRISVFITDWTPCPAACAVTVHRHHPVLGHCSGVPEGGGSPNWFTGIFVRHPLTGDLLPVWVADWVRPEFGTGAVLVNPAHSEADLAFGRANGMPIRFGLIPEGCSDIPGEWPVPPVIKEGHARGAGRFDGLTVQQAREAYLTTLMGRGLAEPWQDRKLPPQPLATIQPCPPEAPPDLWYRPDIGMVTATAVSPGSLPMRLTAGAALRLVASILEATDKGVRVYLPVTSRKTTLISFAGLLEDLPATEAVRIDMITVETAEGGNGAPDKVLAVALVAFGGTDKPIVLRADQIKQASTFLELCRSWSDTSSPGVKGPDPSGPRDWVSSFKGAYKALKGKNGMSDQEAADARLLWALADAVEERL